METKNPESLQEESQSKPEDLYRPFEELAIIAKEEELPETDSKTDIVIEPIQSEDMFLKETIFKKEAGNEPVKPVSIPKEAHPFIVELLQKNPVFASFPVPNDTPSKRTCLPCKRDPNSGVNIWQMLKSSIGRDLSRIAMPVYVNDPISMLQKIAELLEFADLLRKANNHPDQYMRLAYIMAFFFALNPYSIDRLKKPFNPLLGETFEYNDNGIRFIAEQVSHHPPISAFYCESDDFTFEGYYQMKSTISMSGFMVTPKGPFKIRLLKTNETFSYTRPSSSLHNIIIGTMYIWHYGDAIIINEKTKDKLVLNYKSKGWTSSHDFECIGNVMDSTGKPQLDLIGKWNSHLNAVNKNKEETSLFVKVPLGEGAEQYYHFSEFSMNLNHLTPELIKDLPPTDSRFRPDQRAYENGDLKLATDEKVRLEESQRHRRKILEENKDDWKPLWFIEDVDNHKEPIYEYNGKYFGLKEDHEWPDTILNLYN